MKKKFILGILISCIITGCNNNQKEELKWENNNFSEYGIENLEKPENYIIKDYSNKISTEGSLTININCNKNCDIDNAINFAQNIYDKVNEIATNGIYRYDFDETSSFLLDKKIDTLNESAFINTDNLVNYQFLYEYNNKNNYVSLNGTKNDISITFIYKDK